MQAKHTHAATGSAPKMYFSNIWEPYMVKFDIFHIQKAIQRMKSVNYSK